MAAAGKNTHANWDLMQLEFMLPGPTTLLGSGESGELIWDFVIPKSTGTNEYWIEIAC